MAGPANPGLTEQIREPKNMLQGLWRRHSDFQFENQRKTVHNYGTRLIRRWGKDRVEVVGYLQAAYDTDGKRRPNGAEQVVIEEMMAKKQRLNRMTENKPNEYPRTVLPASGGNVRRPIKSFAPTVLPCADSRVSPVLADTNRFAGASNGGPLLNLDHREDSINSNGLPAPVPMLAEKDRALNALNQLGSIQRKINGSSAAFSKGGNSKLDVPKHWSRALVPPRGASVPQPP
ncbi:pre-mRNA splicing factor prp17 [Culex quinquefasciatus]|uniref:Pre-mRNA splicing factor prp17 n=1 Tax=Culex quinquefasciatus TaxID=7176 RepID=B0XJD7_CULQU|nr:pre-mRNA splicing factor prp17 [Culex quinquefasciatus]|eukprot:XP_001869759.1 pre-mRNA splicing factor prp17 [Culex quinquefasciatus]